MSDNKVMLCYVMLCYVNRNGNGKAYDRGDYNSSFALRAVELKMGTYKCCMPMCRGCLVHHLLKADLSSMIRGLL